ncbi:hypothetical protein A8C56_03130 [Niabella ginsenosidivorans]|uniref:Uncharacterized protein n=1 Tax=Niabella ginsenosidivorans TaxID=1176587 RepID=A0A1A9I056_9BACT|nr:hypothetical protein [Niabella ginsenosidivorans]ANH80111.1 hypothetical protein A8C56_03130 [Niabella ginsenosidivorans]
MEGRFFRALLLMLYACFFIVQFNTRTISAKAFQWHPVNSITPGSKEKVVKAAHNHSKPAKRLNKRFQIQQVLLIAAFVLLLASIPFFIIRKKYGICTALLYSVIHYPWSLRGPPETA